METVPRRPRTSTLRVTGVDGATWEGEGEGFALAARDLGRKHHRGRAAYDLVLTAIGVLVDAQAAIEDGHPADCPGCTTCRVTLPLIRRMLEASELAELPQADDGWKTTAKGEALVAQLAGIATGATEE